MVNAYAQCATASAAAGWIDMSPFGVINVADFAARGDGTTNDSAAIQSALNAIPSTGCTVVFPEGTYILRSPVTIPNRPNITIQGLGKVTIRWDTTGLSGSYLFQNAITSRFTGVTPSADLTAGTDTITIPTGNASSIQVGDFIQVTTTKANPLQTGYKLGTYRRALAVNTGTGVVTLDGPVHDSLAVATDAPQVAAYAPLNYFTMQNMRFEMSSAASDKGGVALTHAYHPVIQDCQADGLTTAVNYLTGFGIGGIGIRLIRITSDNFYDSTLSNGYGCNTYGHDVVVRDCSFSWCKHGHAGGAYSYRTFGLLIEGCYTRQALLDAHGNCEEVEIRDCTMVDVGAVWGGSGAWLRGPRGKMINNNIVGVTSPPSATAGLKILDICSGTVQISGNIITGCTYGIKTDESIASPADMTIEDNTIDALQYGIYVGGACSGVVIDGNTVKSGQYGMVISGDSNSVVVSDNSIRYGATGAGEGVQISGTTATQKSFVLTGNYLRAASSNGTHALRLLSKVDTVSIIGNVIDISGAAGGSLAVHLGSATDLTALTMYGTKGAAAEDAVQTRVKAGVPSDADFSKAFDGMLVLDSTDGRLYFRYGGAWHYVTQTA